MSVGELDRATRDGLRRLAGTPAWATLVLAVPLAFVGGLPTWVRYAPLVASGLVFGMPHGAVDHLAAARVDRDADPRRQIALVVGVYAVLGGAYLLAWFLAPVASALAFVALTWFHWGQGDLYYLRAVSDGAYPVSRPHRVATALLRGAMPMAVPLLAFPEVYRRIVGAWVGLFGGSTAPIAPLFGTDARLALGVALAAVTLGVLARGAVAGVDEWRRDAGELALLWTVFSTVPPLLAIGLYFSLWHATRHVARLALIDDPARAALARGDLRTTLARFARDAAPLTAVALAGVGGLALLVPRTPTGLGDAVAVYLVAIAVLTLPHVAVVTWMDLRQGVW